MHKGDKQVGDPFPTEKKVWQAALLEGLITDVPVADEASGQVLPVGYPVKHVTDV